MNKSDNTYALFWAKKIKAINILGGCCNECGEQDVFKLEFHHQSPKDKEENIGHLLHHRWDRIKTELKKCKVLCKNCHYEVHNSRFNPLKEKLLEIKGVHECGQCGYNKTTSSLDFHHINETNKNFRVSRGYREDRWKIPLDLIITEMDKCVVICRNCHSVKHVDTKKFKRLRKQIEHKVNNHRSKQKKIDRAIISNLHQEGCGVIEISRILGCAKSTISMALKKIK